MNALVPPAIESGLDAGRKASNLAFALRVLPAARRRDALVFYRFCRTLDDIADSPQLHDDERTSALDAWELALAGKAALPANLADVLARHRIDRTLLGEILAGVRSDLVVTRYTTFEELRAYCWRVASAVGLASIRIFGCTQPQSSVYAEHLGLALQLTNILRDVAEDAARGRIYLPAEDLSRFQISAESLLASSPPENFAKLMEFQAARADRFFSEALAARHPADRRALLPAELMRALYQKLLTRMRVNGFRVFEKRYSLGRLEKAFLAARVLLSA